MVPLTIKWPTCKERNRHIFLDTTMSFQDVNFYFLRMLYSWSIELGHKILNFFAFCILYYG